MLALSVASLLTLGAQAGEGDGPELARLKRIEKLVQWVGKYGGRIQTLDGGTFAVNFSDIQRGREITAADLTELSPLVTELRLRNTGLADAGVKDISQLTELTKLDLGGNKLTTLPPEIRRLTKLESLVLSDNRLTALPAEIGELTSLTDLHLDNAVHVIAFGSVVAAKNNQLAALPPEIGQLGELDSLEFYGNKLAALPPEVGRLTKLTHLGLGLSPPPEIVTQGTARVLEYLRTHLQSEGE